MIEREALEIAQDAVDRALRAGASDAEATLSQARRFHVEARETTLSKLEQSTGRALAMRIFARGKRVALATSDLEPEALDRAIHEALEQARYVAQDPFSSLPDTCGAYAGELSLYDAELARRDDAAKIEDALALERLVRAADVRVVNSSGSHYNDAESLTALVNSAGFAGAYASTRASRACIPVAQDGDVKRTAHYGTSARTVRGLDTNEDVARIAARRAVEMFGARKPPTGRLPVIFERDIAAMVLDDLFAAVSAANAAVGNSWLADRVGDRIGSDLVTIVDDGTMTGMLGSSPFDGEGVATRRTPVFTRGTFETLLYDTYYARKLGAATTGNSGGGGIGSNNFYLEAGTRSLETLIAATARGVLVLDTIGFATEHASGTYSRGARGFMIENGELSYPIDEFTIAGNFAEMLGAIDAVANDLRFDGAVVSPSFRVGEMTISGN
ncbi:MAG TPA: TldD/PmbA family protein [Candidatus Baltobacteraceae bacterium]|nr:TldD/PmbA family protein [Candidatus Baltobacteraceae bacterium]